MTEEAICEWIEGDDWQWEGVWSKVQPLIRCKNCKWHIKGGFCDLYFADRAADEYCSRAERKEE